MSATTFWSADGRPMSAAQFLEVLYGALPEFFKDEDELRRIWSAPDTRKALLAGLADKGFGREPLAEMQKIIEAEHNDLFDVLAFVAFAAKPVTRADRAAVAHAAAVTEFTDKQQGFVAFVLSHYVKQGVDELDPDKLSPLLQLKYRPLNDAFAELDQPDQFRRVFVGFQRRSFTISGSMRLSIRPMTSPQAQVDLQVRAVFALAHRRRPARRRQSRQRQAAVQRNSPWRNVTRAPMTTTSLSRL